MMARRSASYTSCAPVGFGPVAERCLALLLVTDRLRMAAARKAPVGGHCSMYFYRIQIQPGRTSGLHRGRKTVRAGMKAENSRSNRAANVRLAADIGGTFTDIAVFDDKTGR